MLHLSIKKAVKLLVLLSITSSILLQSSLSYSQDKKKFHDSILLKKEIDSVLAKHGLKSDGFLINVISVNQNGGQIAYSITNNYFGDTVKNETNFEFDTSTSNGVKLVTVYPKKGVWQSPFIGLDSSRSHDCIYNTGPGLNVTVHGVSLRLEGDTTERNMILLIGPGVCSKNTPMIVRLVKKNAFFMFGDFTDDDKFYLYRGGRVAHLPKINNR